MHVSIPIILYKFPIEFLPPSTRQLCPLIFLQFLSMSQPEKGGRERVGGHVYEGLKSFVIHENITDIDRNSHAAGEAYFSKRNSFLT